MLKKKNSCLKIMLENLLGGFALILIMIILKVFYLLVPCSQKGFNYPAVWIAISFRTKWYLWYVCIKLYIKGW